MRKIEYSNIDDLKLEYYNSVVDPSKENLINNLLKCFNKQYNLNLNYEKLLTNSFDDLVKVNQQLLFWSKIFDLTTDGKSTNHFNDLFIYEGTNQKKISKFFMSKFNLKICHYCDEQYISSFVDLNNDYLDYLDFLNTASTNELELLKGIGEVSITNIKNTRESSKIHNGTIIKNLKLQDIKNEFDLLKSKNTHNYFTLDHVFPQNKFPFFH